MLTSSQVGWTHFLWAPSYHLPTQVEGTMAEVGRIQFHGVLSPSSSCLPWMLRPAGSLASLDEEVCCALASGSGWVARRTGWPMNDDR